MFLGLSPATWLGLSVIGAIISAAGTLIGTILRDYFLSRSFERWKQAETLEQLYRRFRDPLVLSAKELASRVAEILDQYPTTYLNRKVSGSRPERQLANSTDDPYFQRYKLVSTVYRIGAFLGWIELLRQELTFLHPKRGTRAQKLAQAVERLRSDLADGHMNNASDWHIWQDHLIFREELRAIGETFIETRNGVRSVIGYGQFCGLLEDDNDAVRRWSGPIFEFLMDLGLREMDFRKHRLKALLTHLVALIRLLDDKSVEPFLDNAVLRLSAVEADGGASEAA